MNNIVLMFNNERLDPVTGTTHLGNGYRTFNPVLMQFNCPDSLSPFGVENTHPYNYCINDPVNRLDPDGHNSFWGSFGVGIGIILGALFTPVSGGSSLALALSVLSVTTAVISAGLAIAQQFVERSDPKTASLLGWVAMGTGIVSGLSSAALFRVAPAAKSLGGLLQGIYNRPFGGLMIESSDEAANSRGFNCNDYIENNNNFRHEITVDGFISTTKIKEIAPSKQTGNVATQFVNKFEPNQWTLTYNYRNEHEPFFTNQMIKYQYNRVSKLLGFHGQYPEQILWQDVTNTATLESIKCKEGQYLFNTFFEMTPLGRTTRYILNDFHLKATQVTRETNMYDPESIDLLIKL